MTTVIICSDPSQNKKNDSDLAGSLKLSRLLVQQLSKLHIQGNRQISLGGRQDTSIRAHPIIQRSIDLIDFYRASRRRQCQAKRNRIF